MGSSNIPSVLLTKQKHSAAYFAIYCTYTQAQQSDTQKLRDAWSVLQFTASVSARSLTSFCIPSWTYRYTYTTDWQQPLFELLFRSWSRHLHKSAPYSPKPPRLQKQSSVTFPFSPHRLLSSSASISSNICLHGVIFNYHDRGWRVPRPRRKEEINVVVFCLFISTNQGALLFNSIGKYSQNGTKSKQERKWENAGFCLYWQFQKEKKKKSA